MSNTKPLFICLCAIWNHRHEWTENLIKIFLDQDYEGNAELYLIDDRPVGTNLSNFDRPSNRVVEYYHEAERFPFLMAKYDFAIKQAFLKYEDPDNVYVCVLDDDDIYAQHFLSGHAEVLAEHPWSYPEHVYSAYGGTFQKESAGGRFWTSSAYRLSSLNQIGGFGTETAAHFDQQFLARMRTAFGKPNGPKVPSYIYNWTESQDNHTSFYMGGSGDSWYAQTPPSYPEGPLVPRYNAQHEKVMAMYRVFTGGQ